MGLAHGSSQSKAERHFTMLEQSTETLKSQLRGGLITPERFHMPTLFTLIIFWWTAWMLGLVLVPFVLYGDTDAWIVQASTVALFSCIIAVSAGHGALGYMTGYLRGGSVRHFLLGALLGPIGLLLVNSISRNQPESIPARPTGFMRILDRLAFACGNIWFGISQIVVMIAFLMRATIYETEFANQGSEAAYAAYYNNPAFGLVFLLFFFTIYCATMRKYPFRVFQVGWLMTHTGLLTLMVGCMIMFWGGFNGFVTVLEGHTTGNVYDERIRDLEVQVPSLGYRGKHRVSVDRDPEVRQVAQEIPISFSHNGTNYNLNVEIDEHISRGERFVDIKPLPSNEIDPKRAQAGVNFAMSFSGNRQEHILIETVDQGVYTEGQLNVRVRTFPLQHIVDSFGYVYQPNDLSRGMIRVIRDDKVVSEIPVELVSNDDAGPDGRMVKNGTAKIGPNGPVVTVEKFYASINPDGNGKIIDANPNRVENPGVMISIDGANGKNEVYTMASIARTKATTNAYGLEFEFVCRGEIVLPAGQVVFILGPNGEWSVAMGTSDVTKHEPLVIGNEYRFSDAAPLSVIPLKVLKHATFDQGIRTSDGKNPFRSIHAKVKFDGQMSETWLINGRRQESDLRFGSHRVFLTYGSRQVPLGFKISCMDFRHENYANDSRKAKTYETNVVLRDPEEELEIATLIDMNHPLSHRGYQFSNGSPVRMEDTHMRGIQMSVGRNPGYGTIVVASIITLAGIITVFFFKKRIREWDSKRRAAA
ncbi:MAG: hypothetical protein ACI97A_000092 [Planctomycetota bacterium]